MRAEIHGCYVRASMSADEVAAFRASWPCSHLPDRGIGAEFELHNGDLVDIPDYTRKADDAALNALVGDLKAFVKKKCQEMKDRRTRATNAWTAFVRVRGVSHFVKPFEHIAEMW